MSPSKEIIKSFVNLRSNRDWRRVVEWLREEHIKAAIDSTHIAGEAGQWVNGQAQAIEMLLARIDTAEKTLEASEAEEDAPTGLIV